MPAVFAPSLPGVSRAGSSIVLLVATAGDGNTAFTLPSGWQSVADVTDSALPGLHLFYYPNAPSGTTFGAFTLSAATNVSYTMTEVGANLSADQVCDVPQCQCVALSAIGWRAVPAAVRLPLRGGACAGTTVYLVPKDREVAEVVEHHDFVDSPGHLGLPVDRL